MLGSGGPSLLLSKKDTRTDQREVLGDVPSRTSLWSVLRSFLRVREACWTPQKGTQIRPKGGSGVPPPDPPFGRICWLLLGSGGPSLLPRERTSEPTKGRFWGTSHPEPPFGRFWRSFLRVPACQTGPSESTQIRPKGGSGVRPQNLPLVGSVGFALVVG